MARIEVEVVTGNGGRTGAAESRRKSKSEHKMSSKKDGKRTI